MLWHSVKNQKKSFFFFAINTFFFKFLKGQNQKKPFSIGSLQFVLKQGVFRHPKAGKEWKNNFTKLMVLASGLKEAGF